MDAIPKDRLEPDLSMWEKFFSGAGDVLKMIGSGIKGFGIGAYDVVKDTVVGGYDLVTDPIGTGKALGNMAIHPVQTYDQVKGAIVESYKRDMINGNAESRSHWVTYALGTTFTSVVSTKGAGTLTKGAATSAKAGAATVKSGAKHAVAHARNLDIARLLPYNQQYQLAGVNVPFNVVDGRNLLDQQLMKAEREIGRNSGDIYKNYKPVEYGGTTKINGKERNISRQVFQRLDIDYERVDPKTGKTNYQLMKKGKPPIWKDGTKIELHHLIQREPGSMVELPNRMHKEYYRILHGLVENGGSFRNDPVLKKQYENFRSKYWRWRANQIDKDKL